MKGAAFLDIENTFNSNGITSAPLGAFRWDRIVPRTASVVCSFI
jgi:hypothetical protein